MSMLPFVICWECKMKKFMNQLIYDFMYDNILSILSIGRK